MLNCFSESEQGKISLIFNNTKLNTDMGLTNSEPAKPPKSNERKTNPFILYLRPELELLGLRPLS